MTASTVSLFASVAIMFRLFLFTAHLSAGILRTRVVVEHSKSFDQKVSPASDIIDEFCMQEVSRVAVLLVGQCKTLDQPAIHMSIRHNLIESLGPSVVVFASIHDPQSKCGVGLSYIAPAVNVSTAGPETLNDADSFDATSRSAYNALVEYEKQQNIQFDFVLRSQPDILYTRSIPPICLFAKDNKTVYNFAGNLVQLIPRRDAKSVFFGGESTYCPTCSTPEVSNNFASSMLLRSGGEFCSYNSSNGFGWCHDFANQHCQPDGHDLCFQQDFEQSKKLGVLTKDEESGFTMASEKRALARRHLHDQICTGSRARVAFLVAGQCRFFQDPLIPRLMREHVVDVYGATVFAAVDAREEWQSQSCDAALEVLKPDVIVSKAEIQKLQLNLNHDCKFSRGDEWVTKFHALEAWYKTHLAFSSMEAYEQEHGFSFDWVIRSRPDIVFPRTLPPLCMLEPNVFYQHRGDHVHMAARSSSKPIIDAWSAYWTCKSDDMQVSDPENWFVQAATSAGFDMVCQGNDNCDVREVFSNTFSAVAMGIDREACEASFFVPKGNTSSKVCEVVAS
eukprot:TRINITY_DN74220_c0_g1_i1.p1 TRINITY_DN74220_c0_g1~~TRINITY_DN74220_c0_g1_i1.p1  ORF type:complete len:563 (-),score=53.87 TRINITY_DN74220_c0_g1_i1:236-1924(-)